LPPTSIASWRSPWRQSIHREVSCLLSALVVAENESIGCPGKAGRNTTRGTLHVVNRGVGGGQSALQKLANVCPSPQRSAMRASAVVIERRPLESASIRLTSTKKRVSGSWWAGRVSAAAAPRTSMPTMKSLATTPAWCRSAPNATPRSTRPPIPGANSRLFESVLRYASAVVVSQSDGNASGAGRSTARDTGAPKSLPSPSWRIRPHALAGVASRSLTSASKDIIAPEGGRRGRP